MGETIIQKETVAKYCNKNIIYALTISPIITQNHKFGLKFVILIVWSTLLSGGRSDCWSRERVPILRRYQIFFNFFEYYVPVIM